jgi:hypothetical protein
MQLPWDEHFFEIVIPAWQAYLRAERELSHAVASKDEGRINRARYDALREGGAAAFYLHHFGEVVLRARAHFLPEGVRTPPQVVAWLEPHCRMLRTERPVADVALVRDVADALKHSILTRHLDQRQVAAAEAVLALSTGYGELAFGEGKFGGVEQIVVLTNAGPRALSSVLQNAIDAWRTVAGFELPAIGEGPA